MAREDGEVIRTEPEEGGAHVEVRGLQKTYLHGGRQLKVLNGIDFTLRFL